MNRKVIVGILMVIGLASPAGAASWQDIKQQVGPAVSVPASTAYLKVYTRDETVNDGGYLWQRGPRYTIFSGDGKKITNAQNEFSDFNEFSLSPGKYVIVPQDRQYKGQIIGAVLEPGKVTEVHMMGG